MSVWAQVDAQRIIIIITVLSHLPLLVNTFHPVAKCLIVSSLLFGDSSTTSSKNDPRLYDLLYYV